MSNRRKVTVYPSQLRKGDIITIRDYTSGRLRTHRVPVTGDPQEASRGIFTGERRIDVPIYPGWNTLWSDNMTYTAGKRITVERER